MEGYSFYVKFPLNCHVFTELYAQHLKWQIELANVGLLYNKRKIENLSTETKRHIQKESLNLKF